MWRSAIPGKKHECRETGGEVPERLFECLSKVHRAPEASDEADSEDYLTLPDESEEPE